MAGRIALVTGGTRGIGLAIAHALRAQGASVAVVYNANEAAAQKCRDEGFLAVKFDVGDFAQCQAAVREVETRLGGIDILVNNAGITRDATLHKMTPEAWNDVIRVDLTGAFNMTRQVIEGMRSRGFGRVINIASINGQKGQFGQTNYAAAKAGLIGFTKSLAQEGARAGVTANAIAPGYIATDMVAAVPPAVLDKIKSEIPVARLGQPEEIARCAAFLASDDAGFITGATFAINGGQYLLG